MNIPFTFYIKIDEEDVRLLAGHRVYLTESGYPYIVENKKKNRIHNLIMPKKEGLEIDHINRNKLDNRKSNLRYVTRAENCWNISKVKNKTSAYKGVHYDSHTGKWRSAILVNGLKRVSGRFGTEIAAKEWYDKQSFLLRGSSEYAN